MRRTLVLAVVLIVSCSPLIAGSFTPGPESPFFVEAVDFNHDGLDDLIDGQYQYGMRFWVNTGGGYTLAKSFPLANGEQLRGTLDVNGDGIPDLITSASDSAPASVSPGVNPTPRFTLYLSTGGLNYRAAGMLPAMPTAIDANSDGKDDIVMFLPNFDPVTRELVGYNMTLELSNGDGTFERKQTLPVTFSEPYRGFDRGMAVGDVNGDGHPDLLVAAADELMIFYGRADGTLSDPVHHYLPRTLGNIAVAQPNSPAKRMYDIDGDGHLDLVLMGTDFIRVLYGDGQGGFPRASMVTVPSADGMGSYLRELAFGNFTSTLRTDIAAGAPGDLVIFTAPGGVLREASHTSTGLTHIHLTAASLRVPSQRSDLIVGGDAPLSPGAPVVQAIPRLYFGDAPSSAAGSSGTRAGRNRAVASPASAPLHLNVTLKGDCAPDWVDSWQLARDGVFATDQNSTRTVDAAFDGDAIDFRVTHPDGTLAMDGTLGLLGPGLYVTYLSLDTACGKQLLRLEATVVR